DKTSFIREWWESKDSVTLIARPRRFGKTLNMSMLEYFFSVNYSDGGGLFEGLSIWEEEDYRSIQGTYPVISLSFANVKERDFASAKIRICQLLTDLYIKNSFLLDSDVMTSADREFFQSVEPTMPEVVATIAIYKLSDFLYRYYGKKVIILLDEYDTPMQEAYVGGFWEELVGFIRSLFNSAFKTNPWLERAIMTGITRVSKESIFSDLNNLEVVTATSNKYATAFGFTQKEVSQALKECGLEKEEEEVGRWYDGFIFGKHKDIYNPWSILNFLDKGRFTTYWANTSSNSLVGKLIREGSSRVKESFEELLKGKRISTPIDEQIVYSQLGRNEEGIWSLLLASGYLKVLSYESYLDIPEGKRPRYELELTNLEVRVTFLNMVRDWFSPVETDYNDFIRAMLQDNLEEMNGYMNRVALNTFSYFDAGRSSSGEESERFYHGFVLGLVVELRDRYYITSNRESGFGRYDVLFEPKNPKENDAIILEFKVFNPRKESSLEETVGAALKQIEDRRYAHELWEKGIAREHIRSYGFAFEGKQVLIGGG
ncbi:MAG: AAA family ATPase, partial [Lachnospiraceae bacterium]